MAGGGVINTDDPEETKGENGPPPYSLRPYSDEDLANTQDMKYPLPNLEATPPGLSCLVIIPQRSGSKGRGFMRAYAPVLADCDISEESFLAFLKSFYKASMVIKPYGHLAISEAVPAEVA